MRLSEAIRLGAMMKPQTFGALQRTVYFRKGNPYSEVRTCAIGAAMDACGVLIEKMEETQFRHVFADHKEIADTLMSRAGNPISDTPGGHVHEVIVYLNDVHRWTREAIADWVASVERHHDLLNTVAVIEHVETQEVMTRCA